MQAPSVAGPVPSLTAEEERPRARAWINSRPVDLLLAAAAVLIVVAPMVFTNSGFAIDFTNHLWLTWVQGKALLQAGHPSYFLNTDTSGVFYPWFAFYGGTLYAIGGGISDLLGDEPIVAYVAFTTAAVAACYGGMLWLGRQLGLSRWASHAPALAVLTSAYFITNLYGRGAWSEFMAVAAIAPLVASAVYLARTAPWRPWPVLVFVLSTVIFTGSHNITLLWGTSVLALALVVAWLALGAPMRLPMRRLTMVAGLGVASLSINAWFLLPDIAYAHDVFAFHDVGSVGSTFLDAPLLIFNPLRAVPSRSTTPALFVQVPDWFLLWSILTATVLLWGRRQGDKLRRAWIGAAVLTALVLVLLTITPLWSSVPSPFNQIEFPYRLGSYIFYATGVLVLLSALVLRRAATERRLPRAVASLRILLVGVCAVSLGLCVWQEWAPNTLLSGWSYSNREEALASTSETPRTWYDRGSYNDEQAPLVKVSSKRLLIIPPGGVKGDRFAGWEDVPPGMAPIETNIAGGSYLVHISGLTRIGRTGRGFAVVRRTKEGKGPVYVVIEVAHNALLVTGWVVSVLACLAVFAVLLWTSLRTVRRRRSAASVGA
jgi:hypothetical protein